MNVKSLLLLVLCFGLAVLAAGCKKKEPVPGPAAAAPEFQWQIDQFADLRILRYQVPGFEALSTSQKELVYYLNEAALCGRDIFFDQNYKHNLKIRRTLDAIVQGYKGDRNDPRWAEFTTRSFVESWETFLAATAGSNRMGFRKAMRSSTDWPWARGKLAPSEPLTRAAK